MGGWGVLGGGLSWFEKLPCENALLALLLSHRGTFSLAILFQNISVKMSDSDVSLVHFSWATLIDFSLFVVTLRFLQTSVALVILVYFKMLVTTFGRHVLWIS